MTNPDTNYHSVFFSSVRKFIFSGDDFRIIFSKSTKSQFASLPSGSMTVFCLMRSLNCQIIPFGYYSSSGLCFPMKRSVAFYKFGFSILNLLTSSWNLLSMHFNVVRRYSSIIHRSPCCFWYYPMSVRTCMSLCRFLKIHRFGK